MHASLRPLWRRLADGPRERQAIAFLRIATGLFFLYVGFEKLHNPSFPLLMAEAVKTWASSHPQAVYQAFLETVILPNDIFFARFVTWAEIVIGASYLTGALIRYTGVLALILNVNFLLATQHTGADALGINLAFLGIHTTLLMARAGCSYGVDAILQRWTGKKTSASPRLLKSAAGKKRKSGTQTVSGRKRNVASARSSKTPKTLHAVAGAQMSAAQRNRISRNHLRPLGEDRNATDRVEASQSGAKTKSEAKPPEAKTKATPQPPPLIPPRIRDLRDS